MTFSARLTLLNRAMLTSVLYVRLPVRHTLTALTALNMEIRFASHDRAMFPVYWSQILWL